MAQTKILGRVTDPDVGGAVYEDPAATTVLDRTEITAADRAMQRAVALGNLDQNFTRPLLAAGARRMGVTDAQRERRKRRRQFAYAQKQFGSKSKIKIPYEARWWVAVAAGAALVLSSMVGIGVAMIVENFDKVEQICR